MDQKIALVTGSTRGIGKAIAQRLLNEGHIVIISSEIPAKGEAVLKDFKNNQNAHYAKADISNLDDLNNLRETILDKFGTIDYLVANAGIMPLPCGIDDITEEVINKTIDTNLKGTFYTLQIFGDAIQKFSKDNGAIVTLTSVDGIIGEPYGVIYSATKAGIISLTKSFARKLSNPLVRVNAVAPGLTDTPLTATTGEDPSWTTDLSIIKRMGTPEEVANAINFLLNDEASFITGQVLAVDGGFTLK